MNRPPCAHVRQDGQPCRALAVIVHPEVGPVCSRHERLLAKQERQEPDLSATICCRVTADERDAIHKAADLVGLSLSQLVRRRVLEIPLPAPRPLRAEALMMKEWSVWGNNLNQATRCLNRLDQGTRDVEAKKAILNTFLSVEAAKTMLQECRERLIYLCAHVRNT